MTISRTVYEQLFEHGNEKEKVIRLRPTEAKAGAVVLSSKLRIQMWTKEEHERFLEALEKFPAGPWKRIAEHIGTKTPRQTMTHAQKYRQKIYRRQRGLRNQKRGPAEEGKLATSPSGVAEHGHANAQASTAAGQAGNGFGLLDILAYSAAQSEHSPSGEVAVVKTEDARSATSSPQSSPSKTASPICNNSHLPPLAQILQLRGSQAAQ